MSIGFASYFLLLFFFLSRLFAQDTHEELLNKLEINYPTEIFFEQTTEEKNKIKGWMIIGGKGKVRTEFKPPNNLVIVGTGKWLIFHDARYDRTTYLPINQGILSSFINPDTLKKSDELNVLKEVKEDSIIYKVSSKSELYAGKLEIVFTREDDAKILEWTVTDKTNKAIKIKVTSSEKLKQGDMNKKNFFSFSKDMRNNEKAFLGPYKRKIKKTTTSGRPGDN